MTNVQYKTIQYNDSDPYLSMIFHCIQTHARTHTHFSLNETKKKIKSNQMTSNVLLKKNVIYIQDSNEIYWNKNTLDA